MFRKSVKQKYAETKKNDSQAAIIDMLARNRKEFISYNIARTRELIRYLSPEKFELFHTIPFLLHVNTPDFPGYMDQPLSAYGIYGFHDSGFWKEALGHFRFREKDMQPHLAGTYIIKGLYLMGSTGTLAQGEFSDFDYWVVVDEKNTTKIHFDLLEKKLVKIGEWSFENYNQEVNFFILNDKQVRRNNFFALDEESSGTAQKTILKEEFYRTFIMIAGQIPVWSVLPSGLNDEKYKAHCNRALNKNNDQFDNPYIDLGNLTSITKNECPGAILWQLYKTRSDPVKSFIKASLIASYYYEENEMLPCDLIKKKFTESEFASSVMDPYAAVFDRILKFYQNKKDRKNYEMAKRAIFLRIYGHPLIEEFDENAPKARHLADYVSQWEWGKEKTGPLKTFEQWPEKKKLAFDETIRDRIIELYRQVATIMVDRGQLFAMQHSDLQAIKNKISALFQEKEKKIPKCSAYLKAKASAGRLKIICLQGKEKGRKWSCYEHFESGNQYDGSTCLFKADEPLEIVGWIIANRLADNNPEAVIFEDEIDKNSSGCAARLFHKVHQFMSEPDSGTSLINADPEFVRLFIAVEGKKNGASLETGSVLIQNSWNEFYFSSLDIKNIENMMLQCYKIGKTISNFFRKAPSRNLQYSVFHNKADDNDYVFRTVREFVNQFKHEASEKSIQNDIETNNNELEDTRPFLDSF